MEVTLNKNLPKNGGNQPCEWSVLLSNIHYIYCFIVVHKNVPGIHPASQSPSGHCPFTLWHLTPFKQWQLLLHPSPKVPLSHAVIRKHNNNELIMSSIILLFMLNKQDFKWKWPWTKICLKMGEINHANDRFS
jgi:hypothetical protein